MDVSFIAGLSLNCYHIIIAAVPIPEQVNRIMSSELLISHMNYVSCNGHEKSLNVCEHRDYDTQYCVRNLQLAGVRCNG